MTSSHRIKQSLYIYMFAFNKIIIKYNSNRMNNKIEYIYIIE